MALILSGDAGITFPVTAGSASAVQASSGRVLQVVTATYSTVTSNSTSTYADTGLTATITPSSATSKVLIFVFHPENTKSNGNANNDIGINLLRNGTQIALISYDVGFTGTAINLYFSIAGSYYDSPSSTSALTYKTQFKNNGGSFASITVQQNNVPSTITLMEIAA